MRLLQTIIKFFLLFVVIESLYINYSAELDLFFSNEQMPTYNNELIVGEPNDALIELLEEDSQLSYILKKRREHVDMIIRAQQIAEVTVE